jgi:hypothetical protein
VSRSIFGAQLRQAFVQAVEASLDLRAALAAMRAHHGEHLDADQLEHLADLILGDETNPKKKTKKGTRK